jgi:predicted DNA-binding protein with PD1-like motif
MQSIEENNLIIARLFTGDDLIESLKTLCQKHKVETAVIISIIGQLKQFTLGYFDGEKYLYDEFPSVHELLSVSGMVSWSEEDNEYKYHLHIVVGNEEKTDLRRAFDQGLVQATNEIILLKTKIK